tara:strand:- start:251 stop:529 length:279 start_codon:yes stop_codon:yes gene_type:complete
MTELSETEQYADGYTEAVTQYIKNKDNPENTFSLEKTLHDFTVNPPENNYQEGYITAVKSIRRYGVPIHQEGNVVYVGWQTFREAQELLDEV